MRVLVLADRTKDRSLQIAQAMADGIASNRADECWVHTDWHSSVVERDCYDVIVAYGWKPHSEAFAHQRANGRDYVFVDGGYWGRTKRAADADGYHKVTINDRHPFIDRVATPLMPADRFRAFCKSIKPWRKHGNHIVLAGMSAKNARDLKIEPGSWELEMVQKLRSFTTRPVIYRPKPTWTGAFQIPGTTFSRPEQPLEQILDRAWAVVTHHSNVSVDGLLEGIPCYLEQGAALSFGMRGLSEIENPPTPDGREDFFNALAWYNWSLAEMRSGACWEFIRSRLPIAQHYAKLEA